MADPLIPSNPDKAPDDEPFDLEPAPETPRWVKIFAVAFVLLILLFAVMVTHGLLSHQGPFDPHMP